MPRTRANSRSPCRQRIAVVTGTRAEFGLLETVLKNLDRRPSTELQLVVTGMHLLRRFGSTVNEIRRAGWPVAAEVRMQTGRDDPSEAPRAVARGISGLAHAFDRLDCDVVVVLGDRIEAFAAASAAALGGRTLAHIHGGDRAPGHIDETLRNAITRMADIHLAASREAADRLKRMGEPPRAIHRVGAPGLDDIREARAAWRKDPRAARQQVAELLGPLAGRPYALVVQHPVGRSPAQEARVMRRIARCLEQAGLAAVAIYPNTDPGHSGIIEVIEQRADRRRWQRYRSLARHDYLLLAAHAEVLVGNSSSGIIESASLGVRAVNVGPRQAGRLRCGPSVVDVSENERAIAAALRKTMNSASPRPRRSVYGDGKAGERIARILARPITRTGHRPKSLTY